MVAFIKRYHSGSSGIIYCLSKKECENITKELKVCKFLFLWKFPLTDEAPILMKQLFILFCRKLESKLHSITLLYLLLSVKKHKGIVTISLYFCDSQYVSSQLSGDDFMILQKVDAK